MKLTRLEKMLMKHEGWMNMVYEDTEGYMTIGYGRNLDTVGISKDEGLYMLRNDIEKAKDELHKYPWFAGLSEDRKDALTNFMFNVGATTFAKFKKMIKAIEAGDFERASEELLDSRYARQVGKRAEEVAELLRGS